MAKMFLSARRLTCLVCAAGLCLLLSASLARAQNLIVDPGFEVSDGNVDATAGDVQQVNGWTLFPPPPFGGTYTASDLSDGPTAHTGHQTFKTFSSFNGGFQQFPVTPGQTYTATVWVIDSTTANNGNDKEGTGTVNQLELNFFPDNGSGSPNTNAGFFNTVSVLTVSPNSALDTWVMGTITVTVPTTDSFMRFQINQSVDDGGAAYWDDASLVQDVVVTTATWNGGGADNNWTTPANWGGTAPVPNLILNFGGKARTTNNNDFPAATQFNGMQFLSGAGAFILNGNSINLGGNIVNNSTTLQTINTPLVLLQTVAFDAATGDMAVGGEITGASGLLLTGPGNVTLSAVNGYTGDTNVAAGTLTIASTGSVATTGNVIVAAASTLNVNGSLTGTPTLNVNGGAVHFGSNTTASTVAVNLTAINLNTNATITVGAASPHKTVLATSALNFTDNTGLIDLGSNDMIIHGGSLNDVTTDLTQGRNAGASVWTGTTGITSSAAAATPSNTALGVEVNDNGSGTALTTTFDGQPVSDGDILVKYTFVGDADLSGRITAADYTLIDNGFNSQTAPTPLTGWHNGDFNYDGNINGDDYTLIDNAFNTQGATTFAPLAANPAESIASTSSSVPEPTSLLLLAAGVATLFSRAPKRP